MYARMATDLASRPLSDEWAGTEAAARATSAKTQIATLLRRRRRPRDAPAGLPAGVFMFEATVTQTVATGTPKRAANDGPSLT